MVSLFVLAVFILFIVIDFAVLKYQGKTHPAFENAMSLSGLSIIPDMEITIPGNIILTRGHIWMKKDKHGLVRLGADDFIHKTLGDISYYSSLVPGKELKRGDVIFEGAMGNKKIKFRSPVSGTVKSINTGSEESENSGSCYNWSINLSLKESALAKGLGFAGSEALNWLKKEYIRLDEFLLSRSVKPELAGVTMYDGGKTVEGASAIIINDIAEDFEKEFLSL